MSIATLSSRMKSVSVFALLSFFALNASSFAELPVVDVAGLSHGIDSITTTGNTMNITTNVQRSLQDFSSFNVGRNNAVNIAQPTSASAFLARVTGNGASTVAGTVSGNGQFWLANPNGVLITPTGSIINFAGVVATTNRYTNTALNSYVSGADTHFIQNDIANTRITNNGVVRVADQGFVVLTGGRVENGTTGSITAKGGDIALAAASDLTLVSRTGSRITLQNPSRSGVENSTFAGVVNNRGALVAKAVEEAPGGVINLISSGSVTLGNTTGAESRIDARGEAQNMGRIRLVAKGVVLANENAVLDVSSSAGRGGFVTVSGSNVFSGATVDAHGATQGGNIAINADQANYVLGDRLDASSSNGVGGNVVLNAGATLAADTNINASGNRGGGTVRLGAGEGLTFNTITADGGDAKTGISGNGGSVEVVTESGFLAGGTISARSNGNFARRGGQVSVRGEFVHAPTVFANGAVGGDISIQGLRATTVTNVLDASGTRSGGEIDVYGAHQLTVDATINTASTEGQAGRIQLFAGNNNRASFLDNSSGLRVGENTRLTAGTTDIYARNITVSDTADIASSVNTIHKTALETSVGNVNLRSLGYITFDSSSPVVRETANAGTLSLYTAPGGSINFEATAENRAARGFDWKDALVFKVGLGGRVNVKHDIAATRLVTGFDTTQVFRNTEFFNEFFVGDRLGITRTVNTPSTSWFRTEGDVDLPSGTIYRAF